ncbi:MAG: adenosylcobinamide-GDP ribazoletransferase, partial [Gordonia sp. (in: high G+C Gram-positive bacteria)]|uniref:adenosylcobinamide-GDP ribazoletransferase n=1 Tax=Gordonia sp. (in: high G+C Gram-positive bacteria) TaxID=84139 RepID=UPI003BB7BC78
GRLGSAGWAAASLQLADLIGALVTVVVVAVFAYAFTRHCARRMGGSNGDVLGATIELSTTIALVALLV